MKAIIENNEIIEFSKNLENGIEIEMTEIQESQLREGIDGFYAEGTISNGVLTVSKTANKIPAPEPEPVIEPEPINPEEIDNKMLEISNRITIVVQAIKNTGSIQSEELKAKTLAILESKRANLEAELSILVSKI